LPWKLQCQSALFDYAGGHWGGVKEMGGGLGRKRRGTREIGQRESQLLFYDP